MKTFFIIFVCIFSAVFSIQLFGQLAVTHPSPAADGDFIEYTQGDVRSIRKHILLLPEGAARVDLVEGAHRIDRVRTYLIPALPNEALRLIKESAVLLSMPPEPLDEVSSMHLQNNPLTLRNRRGGREQSRVIIGYARAENSLIWQGVIDEMDKVASVELAQSIDIHDKFVENMKSGDKKKAVEYHNTSIGLFNSWMRNYMARGGMIYEPTLDDVPRDGYRIVVTPNVGDANLKSTDLLEMGQATWSALTEEVIISHEQDAITVRFKPNSLANRDGFPLEIPAAVRARLMSEPNPDAHSLPVPD